jgi:hypothetical protein
MLAIVAASGCGGTPLDRSGMPVAQSALAKRQRTATAAENPELRGAENVRSMTLAQSGQQNSTGCAACCTNWSGLLINTPWWIAPRQ